MHPHKHKLLAVALFSLGLLCGLGALFPDVAQAAVQTMTASPLLGMVAGGAAVTLAGFPIVAMSEDQLKNAATPRGLEAYRYPMFDTATYTSGTTTTLTFFNQARNDPTLSNQNGSGQLPAGNWFRMFRIGLDFLGDATLGANTALGVLDDLQKLMLVGRPVLTVMLNGKAVVDTAPLSFLHTSGGAVGSISGTWTAPQQVQVGNNSFPDEGFSVDGSIIIPPLVGFSATITWASAQTLASGDTPLRLWFDGIRQRPVS